MAVSHHARECTHLRPCDPDSEAQDVRNRSSYTPFSPADGTAGRFQEVPGHVRGRMLRAGSVALLGMGCLAAAAVWVGGASRVRDRASLRSGVGLHEHKECGHFESNVDYRGLKVLHRLEKITSSKVCNLKCHLEPKCTGWSWGKLRNVHGITDVCFLKEAVPGKQAQEYHRYGFASSLKEGTPCTAAVESNSVFMKGHIKSPDGLCLEATQPKGVSGGVHMWTCMPGRAAQEWTYTEKTGQVRNGGGLCLSAVDRSKPYVDIESYPCDSGNWSQQWMHDEESGIIKNWRGACLDAGERKVDGGMLYTQTCDAGSDNQQWFVGVSGHQPAQQHFSAGTLYCFALMLPGSYEQDLLAMQHEKRASLFACDDFSVYSNRVIEVVPGVNTSVVNSDLKCGKGGEFGTALNLDIFIAVWTKVISDAKFEQYDWTVKVDPDAVFFPDRLREILTIHPESKRGVYLNNCKFGMHGPLEVFSRNAVTEWATGSPHCVQHFQKQCGGDCFWGEDLFVDQCLWKVLEVRRDNDFRLLVEDHCEPPSDWDTCTDGRKAAFHPFKTQKGYIGCLENATKHPKGAALDPPTKAAATPLPSAGPEVSTTRNPHSHSGFHEHPSDADLTDHHHHHHHHHHDHDSHTAGSAKGQSHHRSKCHTVRDEKEPCWIAVDWAMHQGIRLHPSWYPNLTVHSSWFEFQAALHDNPHADCPRPCDEDKDEGTHTMTMH